MEAERFFCETPVHKYNSTQRYNLEECQFTVTTHLKSIQFQIYVTPNYRIIYKQQTGGDVAELASRHLA
jgi:hypothetical protein